ncbi:reverse transcriptase (RNA-dependent DNA polymerase) [Gracilibacillus halophilus YIM-C55.5]|uniref:Reverse transcriptase (RNA-dependent DNA polymerase) n=1 Tax=Gracilibacillus halophilus YIM-C55.5 TaxID=1308866 RepID=N4WHF2_9BACI|nr:group II intron maturase-specific domain-containing protein [Gracilibacillus halophilus]ENH95607.1 reverse transcriptase (RNA-dependent DNA polymerase) [Gracilibacillus halophilus YIM-C55.5]
MEWRLERLSRYLVGWIGYYQLTETPTVLKHLDGWIRRRLRMIRWKEWKTIKARYTELRKRGVSEGKAWKWANTRKAYWRISESPILHKTLGDHYWRRQGLKSLFMRYKFARWT